MSGERSSTTRRRLAGKSAAVASPHYRPPHVPGEKYCARCQLRIGCRRVYMHFMLREGWHCQFLEADLQDALPKKLNLGSSQKVIETAERGGYNMNLERAAGVGPWDREGTRRHLAASDRRSNTKSSRFRVDNCSMCGRYQRRSDKQKIAEASRGACRAICSRRGTALDPR